MLLTRLRLTNFRNYAALDLAPAPGVNLFVGGNAQGKTNILEALALLSTSRSPRAGRENELIRFGENTMHVGAEVSRETSNDLSLDVILAPPDNTPGSSAVVKTVRINTVKHPKAVDLCGQMQSVGFWPDDVEVVRGEPSGRRRFVNTALCQISPQYCFHLAQYRRTLEQRNRLLKTIRARGGFDQGNSLEAWNQQMMNYGSRVIERRIHFVADLHERARAVHLELTGGEELSVAYLPNVPVDGGALDAIQRGFEERLAAVREDEFIRGVTLAGPHRDDLSFTLGTADARTYGSLGQQRSVALSLRVAELRLMEEEAGEPCIVLMDEILAELDDDRAGRLIDLVMPGRQAFVTSTHPRRFPRAFQDQATIWTVQEGTVSAAAP